MACPHEKDRHANNSVKDGHNSTPRGFWSYISVTLKIKDIHNLYVECQKVEYSKDLFHKVIKIIRDIKPDLIITHAEHDKHEKHEQC